MYECREFKRLFSLKKKQGFNFKSWIEGFF